MTLKYPLLLLLLLIYVPLIFYWIYSRKSRFPAMGISTLSAFAKKRVGGRAFLIPVCRILQLAAIGFLIVALARPQKHDNLSNRQINATDIVLALDLSGSMDINDIAPSRFEAAKATASNFIKKRTDDNIGIVAFAAEALTYMPLTNDQSALQNAVDNLRMGQLRDGTAIGDGLVMALNRVLNGPSKSKSVILMTDGTNNTGNIDPQIAAEIAEKKGVKVYTIGMGKDGTTYYTDPYGMATTTISTAIDEEALKAIAAKSGGKYFRVTDSNALKKVFQEIDAMEKTRIDTVSFQRTEEAFMPWLIAALCCLCLSVLIRFTVLSKIP